MPQPPSESKTREPEAYECPWCDGRDPVLKKVLLHMESAYYQRWCDLILYPPIAGGVY